MSKEAMIWADSQEIADPAMTAVLVRLAYMHHSKQALFPSQATLARLTQFSPRKVWEALKLLELLNVIVRLARSNGAAGRTSDAYVLPIAAPPVRIAKAKIKEARTTLRNSHRVRSALAKSQLAPGARGSSTGCEGVEVYKSPIHREANLSVSTEPAPAAGARPLRIIDGGRA